MTREVPANWVAAMFDTDEGQLVGYRATLQRSDPLTPAYKDGEQRIRAARHGLTRVPK